MMNLGASSKVVHVHSNHTDYMLPNTQFQGHQLPTDHNIAEDEGVWRCRTAFGLATKPDPVGLREWVSGTSEQGDLVLTNREVGNSNGKKANDFHSFPVHKAPSDRT